MSKSKPADNRLPIVLIALMKGVVERDRAPEVWQSLLSLQSAARDHVGVLGLDLMLDEAEGYAYLRQKPAGEDGESELPRLMRRFQLSYPVSLLLVLLRQRLAEFDAENSETRLIVTRDEMIELIRTFLSPMTDDIRLLRQIDGHINKVAELADWDYAALSVELSSIDLDDDNFTAIGFEEREIAALVNDLDIIFDPDSDNSNSGGHSVNKSMSIWLYDYKLTDSRDSSWLFFDEHLADIRSLPQELVVDAIIGGLRGLLD